MCGILGMIGAVPSDQQKFAHTILQNIFISSKKRGTDASGFSAIHKREGGRLITEKRPIDSLKFVERSEKFKALAKDMPSIFIGHTRFSTSGSPQRCRNNHPFNSQQYSLVHNGGINSWQNVVKINDIKMRTETDSEILLHLIERKEDFHLGIGHAMEKVGATSRVAVAMLKHDVKNPTLFLFRNLSNPVNIMTFPSLHAVFFASESKFLSEALESVWGKDVERMSKLLEINIETLPDWTSIEWNLDDDTGLPVIHKEESVARVYSSGSNKNYSVHNPTMGFTPTKTIGSGNSTSLPMSKDTMDLTTGDLLKNVSPETRADAIELSRAIRESSTVLNSIRREPFMTNVELEHFKKWMSRV